MHVISQKRLRDFWLRHPRAESDLRRWYAFVRRVRWETPGDIKAVFSSASILANNRVVFNIGGNQFRLVVKMAYEAQRVYVRFVGTHAAYDDIDAANICVEAVMKAIRPIKSKKEYETAVAEIDRLIDAKPGTDDHDRLEVLSLLVEAYEESAFMIDTDDIGPIQIIEFWMAQNKFTRRDLEPFLGGRARVSEVLRGKRPLSLAMIRRLVGAGIPAALLVQPLPVRTEVA